MPNYGSEHFDWKTYIDRHSFLEHAEMSSQPDKGIHTVLRIAMNVTSFAAMCLIFVVGCGPNAEPEASPESAQSPVQPVVSVVWQPDADLLTKLGDWQVFGNYKYQIPKGYSNPQRTTQGATQSVIWQGMLRRDKTLPKFWVMVGKLTSKEAGMTLDKSCAIVNSGASQALKNYRESGGEHGTINGMPFYRMTFQGDEPGMPSKGCAVVYHGRDGQNYIHVMALDVASHLEETRPLLEAAARTFRRQ